MRFEPGTMGILIGTSDLLQDGGKGLRFPVIVDGAPGTGFVVRYQIRKSTRLNSSHSK